MIDAATARHIAEEHFAARFVGETLADSGLTLIPVEVPAGWSFTVQSARYIETGNEADGLGNVDAPPVLVNREDGSVQEFPEPAVRA